MTDASLAFKIVARDSASDDFKRLGNTVDRTGGKMRALGKVGKIAGLGLAAGVAAAGAAGFKLAKMAIEDEQSTKLMARQFKKSAGATKEQIAATESWISKQGVAKGVADDDLRPALSNLVTATHSVSKAQKLASLAMDISAAKGKPLAAVSVALAKAQNGSVGGLAKLGIATKDAAGKTKSFMQLQKDLASQFGGAASAKANTMAGKMQRLKVIMSETGESIGYKLLPAVTAVATWILNKGVPAIGKFGDWFKIHVNPILSATAALVRTKVIPAIASTFPFFEKVGTFITTKIVPAFSKFGSESTKQGGILRQYGQTVSSVFNSIKSITTSLVQFAKVFWGKYGDLITKYGINTIKNFVTVVRGELNIVAGIFKTVAALLHGDWGGAWAGIKQITRGAVQVVKGSVSQLWNAVRTYFSAGVRSIGTVMKRVPGILFKAVVGWDMLLFNAGRSLISGVVRGIKSKFGDVKNTLGDLTNKVTGWKGPPKRDKVLLTPAGMMLIDGLIGGINARRMKVKDALGKITDIVQQAGAKIANLKSIKAGFLSTFSADSVFGLQLPEKGNKLAALLNQGKSTAGQASVFNHDIHALMSKGLSKSLLQQLRDQGFASADQVHVLAGASAAQIASLNKNNSATNRQLQAAGLTVGNTLRGGNIDTDIQRAQRREDMEMALVRALQKMPVRGTLEAKGNTLIAVINAEKRHKGQKPI